jgi:hypothetical protein
LFSLASTFRGEHVSIVVTLEVSLLQEVCKDFSRVFIALRLFPHLLPLDLHLVCGSKLLLDLYLPTLCLFVLILNLLLGAASLVPDLEHIGGDSFADYKKYKR